LTQPGPELVINGTFTVGNGVPAQFSGTNCLLTNNSGTLEALVTVALGTVTARCTITGLSNTQPTWYKVTFDYLGGNNANFAYCNVNIIDQTGTSYYFSNPNLSGVGTFQQYILLPASSTALILILTPSPNSTGNSNTGQLLNSYLWDNFFIEKYK
jgi:hypothetical protein